MVVSKFRVWQKLSRWILVVRSGFAVVLTGTQVTGRCRRMMQGSDLAGLTLAGAVADLTELL